ncbi:MAG: CDGSH iron-sulfur domain-containing protein [Acidimicrobiia bacterium]|nr:CDGSH iron-sulfur domain-containing protein [Acidimicrobiia bacterium]
MADTDPEDPASVAARVKVQPNGPYVVSGGVPLRRKEAIVSEHGEPLSWRSHEVTDRGAAYALCRCGGSANKPYCDGTHASNGFDGTESAPTEELAGRSTSYPGTGIEVFDDRSTCVHAGFCGNRVSNVWKMVPKTDDTTVRAQVMAMIERCPSGALTYAVDGVINEPDLPVEISVLPDGPLWLSGGIPIDRADGQPVEVRNRVTLCRCGESANKPLCDGSHTEAGFTD